jgi:threonine synthase
MRGYRCIACASEQGPDFGGFVCPLCGGNLDITYDYAIAGAAFPGQKDELARDIFDFASLLPVTRPGHFPLRVGATPLYAVPLLGQAIGLPGLYLKDESLNPSGSIKDRASAVALQRGRDLGASVIGAASTGNAGSSLACLAAAAGMRAVVFVPEAAPLPKLTQLLAFGADVLAVRGSYDDAFELCLEACRAYGWFNRNTGHNPFTREGKKTCVFEIWQALGGTLPDRIVVAAGDGNVLSGVWKGCRDLYTLGLVDSLPKIDAAQSEASAAISLGVQALRGRDTGSIDWTDVRIDAVNAATVADSIAVDQPRDGLAAVQAVIESGGEAVSVPDSEILNAIPEMAKLSGVFPEPAAAAPLAAVKNMLRKNMIDAHERVVCIVSGGGLKDTARAAEVVGRPHTIEPTLEAVNGALSGRPSRLAEYD